MKKTLKFGVLYFIAYAISGCNYQVFHLFLMGNPLLFVGLYVGVTALILLTPIYPFIEKIIFSGEPVQGGAVSKQDCKTAYENYRWALILSAICSIGWQGITYGYLIKYGALLALLVTTLSRLLTPFLSSYLFGDSIGDKFWYWLGLVISLLGIVAYQYGRGEGDKVPGDIHWRSYCSLALVSLFFMVIGNIVKRFTTSDPTKDSIPIRKTFLGIHYLDGYHMTVRTREFITYAATFVILLVFGLYRQFFTSITDNQKWYYELMGVCWIGIIGGIAFTISVKLTNRISNVTTAAIDGLRPLAAYFLYPLIGLLLAGISYSLNTREADLWGHTVPYLSLIGVIVSCIGVSLSLLLGKPKKGKILEEIN